MKKDLIAGGVFMDAKTGYATILQYYTREQAPAFELSGCGEPAILSVIDNGTIKQFRR